MGWAQRHPQPFIVAIDKKFLRKVAIGSEPDLIQASHDFEYRHNSQYRYSKLGGKTPLAIMESMSKKKCIFPDKSKLLSTH
jgi:putative transposase